MTPLRFPNETPDYRSARDALLAAERELRAQLERVALARRELPLGGRVPEDYAFDAPGGRIVRLSELFAPGKDSLFVYSFMFGPKRPAACPLCTSFLDALDGQIPHLLQRINVAVTARSPMDRLEGFARERGWRHLPLLSSGKSSYQRDYFGESDQGGDLPMANVFVRRGDEVHHFWGSEMLYAPTDGGDARHIDLLWPLWNVLDLVPEGRGSNWYPALSY
jgi:predicted dithiol-disulfide oxidoreductase (DUF899 family)